MENISFGDYRRSLGLTRTNPKTDKEFVEEFEEYLKQHPEEIGLENETDRTGL